MEVRVKGGTGMKNKRRLLILLCIILALATAGMAGCGTKGDTAGSQDGTGGANPDMQEAEGTEVYRVALYFANEEYINTGDETLKKFNISVADITSSPENVYQDTLELLRHPDEGNSTMITEQVVFNRVYLEGNTAYVDFKSVGSGGGSMVEGFLISQIVNTLLNFDKVEQVQFLMNGKVVETLMGHVGTAEPFTKDVFTE